MPVLFFNLFDEAAQERFAFLLLTKTEIQHDGRRGLTIALYSIGFLIKEFFTESCLDFLRQRSIIRLVGLVAEKTCHFHDRHRGVIEKSGVRNLDRALIGAHIFADSRPFKRRAPVAGAVIQRIIDRHRLHKVAVPLDGLIIQP